MDNEGIWSDYDYSLTDKDNKYFAYETIEFLLGIDLESDEDYVPEPPGTTTPTPPPTTPSPTETPYPALLIFAFALIGVVSVKLRNSKKK